MINETDYKYTNEIVCPYCGTEQGDSWECKPSGEGDLEKQYCDSCEKYFTASRHIIVEYCSEKAPCLNGEQEQYLKKDL